MTATAEPSAPAGRQPRATARGGNALALRGDRPGLGYLPALDGLRAVAVLGVMLFHSDLPWARGGFLGVDLFFVLSGFLITSLLLVEQARWGTVDFVAFWGRRARRLLPALFLLLLFACVYAWVFALPQQQGSIGAQGVATFFYVGNWWQIANDQSYLAQFVAPSPLQHTWSLAIEEQYYLLFPVALAGLLALRGTTRGLTKALGFLALASATWMAFLYVPGTDPLRVYYGTDTRVQDLFVGGAMSAAVLAAQRHPDGLDRFLPQRARQVLAPLLLLAVLAFFALMPDDSDLLYRGGFLVFCLIAGTLLVIVSRHDRGPVTVLLTWSPLLYVGIISYGLYLWHWPLFLVLSPERTGLDGVWLILLRFGVTFAVATLSYFAVERPIRSERVRGLVGTATEVYGFLIAGAAVLFTLAMVIVTAPASLAQDGDEASSAVGAGRIRTLFVGDSVPMGLWQEFDPDQVPEVSLRDAAKWGCGLIPVPFLADGTQHIGSGCLEWSKSWPNQAAEFEPNVAMVFPGMAELFDVTVNGRTIPFGTPEYQRYLYGYLDRYFSDLRSSSDNLSLVTIPCHRVYEDGVHEIPRTVNDDDRVAWLNRRLEAYVEKNPDITLIDFNSWMCPPGADPEYRDGVKMRSDGLHFTPEGARLVWEWLAPQIRSIAGESADEESPAPAPADTAPSSPSPSRS